MDMSEQELKLHVPQSARRAVEREIRQKDATTIRLHAMYFDTPDRELARARIALRLRQEGSEWMQTLKMPGANAITRIEINHPRPGPILDLSVYAGTEVEAPLAAIRGELGLRYETDVQRVLRKVRTRAGTVEVAYDTGLLRAGALELPISEVEFELLSGRPAAIFAVGCAWQQRHGLVLDARSKSERGDALANVAHGLARSHPDSPKGKAERTALIADFWAPRGARTVMLRKEMTPAQALMHITEECLDQIVRNAAILSEADTDGYYEAGRPEHVHQLRVGVRRLRSAWRLFDGLATLPPETVQEDTRVHFEAFGMNRDDDVLFATVVPALAAAGMPDCKIPTAGHDDDSRSVAAGKPFQAWLLALLEWSLTPQAALVETPPAAQVPAQTEAGVSADADADAATDAQASAEPAPAGDVAVAAAVSSPATAATAVPDPAEGQAYLAAAHVTPTIIPLNHVHAPTGLREKLLRRLRRLHKRVVSDGLQYAQLETEAKHALRKRAKRLRYGLNFAEGLLSGGRLRQYRKQLVAVQDILGEFNDLAVAHLRYEALVPRQPQAWFAVGWIAARQEALVGRAEIAFKALSQSQAFWK
jgi:inorganic triphosphatase YgiF